ncbi:ubiquitin-related domain-containing protein [Gigaspora margarita]|uniref:Ubiquitin-related domain-containing protein n=1 Tax=Gigaspora margarita TaxID=4874 RepID=A0A8H4AQC0_GIGMA|nr:ubiquitin-related domain-containing protein [Gigaspora margarita]
MSSKSDHDTLIEMGFPPDKVARALKATKGAGLQPAMDWLISHPDDLEDEPAGRSLGEEPAGEPAGGASKDQDEGEIQDGEQTAQSLQCNDCQKLFRDASAAQNHAAKTGHVNFSESTTAIKPLTEEEKQAKLLELKQRLAEKRELRALQDKEDEKSRERMRRQSGRELTEAKSKMEEKEMQKLLAAKKKEKEEEKIAKAKIKAQIEADKKERAAKREAAKQATQAQKQEEAVAEAAAAAAAAKKEYTETRLQIRQPTGAPITQTFQSTDTLQIVHDLVSQHVTGPFKLMTTFPRKVFGDSEMQQTLKDLNLVPSAVLVVNTS